MTAKSGVDARVFIDEETAALDRMIEFASEHAKSIGLMATSDLLMLARQSVRDSRSKRKSDAGALDEAVYSRGLH